MTDVFDAIHTLRAIRSFTAEPVPDDAIARMLDAAVRAPSPQNCQPWAFVVVKDVAARARIAEVYRRVWNWVREPVYGDLDAIEEPSKKRVLKSADKLARALDEAPVFVLAMLDRSRLGVMVSEDLETLFDPGSAYGCVWGAVQNFLLAARALEIGAVTTTLTRMQEDEMRDILGHPRHVETVTLIALGHPRESFGPTTRRAVVECAHNERWGAALK